MCPLPALKGKDEMSKVLSKWYTSGTFVSFSNNHTGLQLNLQSLEVFAFLLIKLILICYQT